MRDCPDDGDRDGRYYRHIRDRKRSTDPAFTLPRPGTPGCPLGIDQGHAEIRGGAGQLSRLETAKRDVQRYDCDSAVQGTKLRDDRRGRPRRVRWRSRDVECFRQPASGPSWRMFPTMPTTVRVPCKRTSLSIGSSPGK